MKKTRAFVLALALIAALFAGCGKSGESVSTNNPSGSAPAQPTQSADAETPEAEDSPYHFAPGNYDVNEQGYPTSNYEYQLPISTTDEVLTYWTTCFIPDQIPEEGYDTIDFQATEQETTGIDIEYLVIPWQTRADSFTTMLAADDLPDLMNQASMFYSGTKIDGIEQGYFVNIFDYKEYCPNYIYFATSHDDDPNVFSSVFLNDSTIFAFINMKTMAFPSAGTIGARGDWLDELNMTNDDIVTVDDLYNVCMLFKTEMGAQWPFMITNNIDMPGFFSCYDTYTCLSNATQAKFPGANVGPGGKVEFYYSNEKALAFVSEMAKWVEDGLIDPDWTSKDTGEGDQASTGVAGIAPQIPTMVGATIAATDDPDCYWVCLKRTVLQEGQTFHLGDTSSYCTYGDTEISAKCENIPLAVTWCDWRYSNAGSFLASYGVEGTTWVYDDNGNIRATDFVLNHPDGQTFNFLMTVFAYNMFAEHGLKIIESELMYDADGGRSVIDWYAYFQDYDYDGAYEWPQGFSLNSEQSQEYVQYAADLDTYISENIISFVNGDKPLSEWDAYIGQLKVIGLDQAIAIYQEAYDAYAAARS